MLTAPVLRALKRAATHLPLNRQTALVARLLPVRFWYRAALLCSRAHGALVERMGGNGPLTTALMLDHWLRELSFSGPYPMPLESRGMELALSPGAKMFCWVHLPLTEVPLRAYLQRGGTPLAVVSDRGKIVGQNEFQVFGWPDRMEALPDGPRLLAQVKTTLRAGKSVVFLADHYLGGPMSEVPVRLAGKLHVPLVLQWAELQADGTIMVTFREAPCPYSQSEAEIAENLRFLREARDGSLKALGWGVSPSS